ncbi:MAG: FG-GAP-like repeat-containing protein [Desulfovermiculus sp.]
MNFVKSVFVVGIFILFMPGSGLAQDQQQPKSFAVLPITIHGPEKYQYLKQGIASMLTSRLTRGENFRPIEDESKLKSWSDVSSQAQAKEALADIQADVLFWGSATISGAEASLDINALEAQDQKSSSYSQTAKVQDVIPALEEMVDSIHADLFAAEAESASKTQADDDSAKPLNTQFVQQGMTDQDSGRQSGLNPSFEYQTGAGQDEGRWQSQALPFASTRMIVEDADNDGQEEIFLLSDHNLTAYVFQDNRLRKLDTFEVSRRTRLLNLNALDMDRDSLSELVVSGMFSDRASSFILQFKDDSFNVLHEDIDLYFNVVTQPPLFAPRLVAQKRGRRDLFAGNVHEAVQVDDKFQLGRKLNLPGKANIFNFTYLPQGEDDYKIIVADSKDRLLVFSRTGERQFESKEKFAASGLGLSYKDVAPGMSQSHGSGMPEQFYYLPTRLVPINLDRDDSYELLVSQSESRAADFFPRYRHFPQGRIQSLSWDGLGLNTVWKTRTIQGTVVDYGIADLNNNGQDDLYVCVNTHPGAFGTGQRKTMIITYALDMVEERGKE